jgi:hypothetical protein
VLLQLSLRFQGRTFGAPGRPAQADLARDAGDAHGEHERAGRCRAVAVRNVGDPRRRWRAAWPASSCAMAHRRGPLPAAPMPRTPPQHRPRRNAPWVKRSASWPGRSSRAQCADRRMKASSPGRNAAHCPGWPLQPQRCFASRYAGRACGAPLTLETSASPAGLTARARPEARPRARAANLRKRNQEHLSHRTSSRGG